MGALPRAVLAFVVAGHNRATRRCWQNGPFFAWKGTARLSTRGGSPISLKYIRE